MLFKLNGHVVLKFKISVFFCAFEGMSAAIILGVAMVTVVYVAAIMVCFLYIRRCACHSHYAVH